MLENGTSVLENLLKAAQESSSIDFGLTKQQQQSLSIIIDAACTGKNKSVLAVTMTLVLKKRLVPEQDIRKHQANMPGGFSGRGFDTDTVTPFLKTQRFPFNQSGSGWLTRSIEQPHPFDKSYPGKITPSEVKIAFLEIVSDIEAGTDPDACLLYMLRQLADWRSEYASLILAKPTGKRIEDIISMIREHWDTSQGASKLPVLVVYASYQCLISEITRFRECKLMELLSHTSADAQTSRIGDVDILGPDGNILESVEVKHTIPITSSLLDQLREKIAGSGVKTFYLLSTNENIDPKEMNKITDMLIDISRNYGCQVIINGVATTIKYYLRLLSDTDKFLIKYVSLLESDKEISFEMKKRWNDIVG